MEQYGISSPKRKYPKKSGQRQNVRVIQQSGPKRVTDEWGGLSGTTGFQQRLHRESKMGTVGLITASNFGMGVLGEFLFG